jgi:alanine-synthesizing transaminase
MAAAHAATRWQGRGFGLSGGSRCVAKMPAEVCHNGLNYIFFSPLPAAPQATPGKEERSAFSCQVVSPSPLCCTDPSQSKPARRRLSSLARENDPKIRQAQQRLL